MLPRVLIRTLSLRAASEGLKQRFWSSTAVLGSAKNWKVVEKVADRQVPPLSNVTINSSDCPVVVCPADPQQYPDSDRLLIYLLKDQENDATDLQLVQATPNSFNIDVHGSTEEQKTLEIHVPVQSNVSAFCSGGGDVSVKYLHSDRLAVVTSSGSISTKDIRCSEIVLATQGGSVACTGVLQGKINIKAMSQGTISCQRLQGPLANLESEQGDVSIASDYCDRSSVTTHSGSVKFGSLHRKCKVEITGKADLIAAGLDGRLQAVVREGNADVQVSNLVGHSNIELGKGNVKLRLGETDNNLIRLSADRVNMCGEFGAENSSENGKNLVRFGRKGDGQGDLKVSVLEGEILVEKSSWIASLNLNKKYN
ncbi:protein FAM185A-like [Cloeon dipterum]|uniref:protein FAM185A-like n=1 Tax=Cloeon dipterum TaxID=197152 RepID=UPI00321F62E7